MKNHYLSYGGNESATGRRYMNAVEVRSRVASSLLSDVIGHLEKLVTAYQRLTAVLAVDLIEHSTSVPGQIHASINTIVEQTEHSLAQFGLQIVDKFSEYYEQNTDFLITQVISSAKAILRQQVYFENIDVDDANSFDVGLIDKIINHGDACCKDAYELLYDDYADANRGSNFSTTLDLIVDRDCIDQLLYYCDYREFTESPTFTADQVVNVVELYENMTVSAKAALRCLPMYGAFLNGVQSWLKLALTINSNLPLQPGNRRSFLMDLEHELDWLKAITRTFSAESMVRYDCL